jgi:hypothetical protein
VIKLATKHWRSHQIMTYRIFTRMHSPFCCNYFFNAFNPTAKNALQLVCRNPVQNFSHCVKKADFIGNLLSDERSLYFPKKIKVRGRYIWWVRWIMMKEPLQWVILEKVWRHSWIVSRRIVHMNHQFFCLGLEPDGKNFEPKGTNFNL